MNLGSLEKLDHSFKIHQGSFDTIVEGITDLSELTINHLLFIKNKNFLSLWLASNDHAQVGVVIEMKFYEMINDELKNEIKAKARFVATVENVNLAMSYFSKTFYDLKIQNPNDVIDGRQMGTAQVDSTAWIAQGVFIGERVTISANVKLHPGVVVMSGASIGENSEIFPNTVIYRNVEIRKNVRIHANCTIGADGFGYNFSKGVHLKVWQLGSVIIHDHVEIGANSCVDSGTFSPTIIGEGSKLDNIVQIGHNCKIGKGVIMCAQAGVAGSTTIGDFTVIGGQAGVSNGLTIGKGVQISGGAVVIGNLGDGEIVGGFPARNIKEWLKGVATLRKLSLDKKS